MPTVTAGRRYAAAAVGAARPFSAATAWNTPLAGLYPSGVPVRSDSAALLSAARQAKGSGTRNYLGTDVTQSTLPVYYVNNNTPTVPVRIFQSWRYGNDSSVDGTYQVNQDVQVPMPAVNKPVGFSDYYVMIRNVDTGDEWGFWKVGTDATEASQPGLDASGLWVPFDVGGGVMRHTCQSAARYQPGPANGTSGGVGGYLTGAALPSMAANPKNWGQRGAKVPETVGLVQPFEIAQGHIDHAIAYAFHGPSPDFVFPAQASDGGSFGGVSGLDIPEGGRIRLKPSFDLTVLPAGAARVVGQCLKDYGAICIDNAGLPKVYLEAEPSAGWGTSVTATMLQTAPLDTAYDVIDWTV